MKLIKYVVLIFLLSFVFAQQNNKEDYDFRRTKWGMSKEQVKISEKNSIIEENDEYLAYFGKVFSKDVMIVYYFANSKLVRARYIFLESHTNKFYYLIDYKSIKDVLLNKYGEPKYDRVVWLNDLYQDDYSEWGLAISIGHLIFGAGWETNTTEIEIYLVGENYQILHAIQYTSKQYKDLIDAEEQKKNKEDF